MMSDNLKPCPFCGENARKSDNGHDVYCLGCGARIAVGAFEGTAQKKDALRVAWWNQRVAQEVPAPADPFVPDAEVRAALRCWHGGASPSVVGYPGIDFPADAITRWVASWPDEA